MVQKVLLCAIQYEVTRVDGQVIFEEKPTFYGTHSQFTLEWKGVGWYLVDTDTSWERIYLPHLVAASAWVEDNHIVAWKDGVGTVTPK